MKVTVEIADESSGHWVPGSELCQGWIEGALAAASRAGPVTVSLCFVDARGSEALNRRYRKQPGPTNVLAFPRKTSPELDPELNPELNKAPGGAEIGDIVVCAELAAAEAEAQGKPVAHHWAHLLIHGCLHLLGYDHGEEKQAQCMEAMEIGILRRLGIPNPYPVC